ncbi:MAG TPA: hypothetical protein DEQ47_03640 [Solibacterales bacterium]|jgi:hypothetical protein|nr:hypothetical protein [Bryobacterales bacterium]
MLSEQEAVVHGWRQAISTSFDEPYDQNAGLREYLVARHVQISLRGHLIALEKGDVVIFKFYGIATVNRVGGNAKTFISLSEIDFVQCG